MDVSANQQAILGRRACTRYGITIEELLSWQRLLDEHGLHGLRALRPAALTLDKRPLGSQILEAIPRLVGRLTPKRVWST